MIKWLFGEACVFITPGIRRMAGINRGVFRAGDQASEGGEDVVVSILALSASRQKPNQSSANAPKITAHFYLCPQIRAGVGKRGISKS